MSERKDDRKGETRIANCGMIMKIIEYHNYKDIVVKFQDNYVKHTSYAQFISGKVKNPNCKVKNKLTEQRNQECRKRYEGKTKIMNNGLSLKVLEYRNANELLCEWEIDKSQITTTSARFDMGRARYSGVSKLNNEKKSEYEQQEFKMKDGKVAKIIQYNSFRDATVILDNDYSKTYNTSIQLLKLGKYFTNDRPNRSNHIGEEHINYQGIPYTISDIYGDKGYVLTFPDGVSKTVEKYSYAVSRSIKHPLLSQNKAIPFNYRGLTCRLIYSDKSDIYFACRCPKCGFEDILSAKEIVTMPHTCE